MQKLIQKENQTGVDKVKPKGWFKYSLQIDLKEHCWTVPNWRHEFGPSFWVKNRGDYFETLLLFEFFCGTPPSCLKVVEWWWVAYRILLSAPGPFRFNWVLDLIGTWQGLGLGGLGPGLDKNLKMCTIIPDPSMYLIYLLLLILKVLKPSPS